MRYDDDRNFQGQNNRSRGDDRRWNNNQSSFRGGADRYDRGYEDDRRFESYGDTDSGRYTENRGRGVDDHYEQNRGYHDRFGSGTDGFRNRASGQSYMDSGNETWRPTSGHDWGSGYGRSTFSAGSSSWGMPGWESGSSGERFRRDSGRDFDREYGRGGNRGMWEQVKDFFGVGPKGYRRSDERIREEASEALARDAAVDASEIEVDVKEGVVHLRGQVSSRWMKRRAEDCVEHLSGVRDVRNEIEVRTEQSAGSGSLSGDQPRSGESKRKLA